MVTPHLHASIPIFSWIIMTFFYCLAKASNVLPWNSHNYPHIFIQITHVSVQLCAHPQVREGKERLDFGQTQFHTATISWSLQPIQLRQWMANFRVGFCSSTHTVYILGRVGTLYSTIIFIVICSLSKAYLQ